MLTVSLAERLRAAAKTLFRPAVNPVTAAAVDAKNARRPIFL
jgi:hypothetical protein